MPCKPCNNEWMSQVEQWTAPVLTPMIDQRPITLNSHDQALIATWATLRSCVWEDYAEGRASSDQDRNELYVAPHQPPIRSWVRIAVHNAPGSLMEQFAIYSYKHPSLILNDGTFSLIVFTLVYGHMVVQTFIGAAIDSLALSELLKNRPDATSVIWPIINAVVDWPPQTVLDDVALNDFIAQPLTDMPKATLL